VVSIAAHALLIAAAGRMVWTRLESPPRSLTEYVLLGDWLRPEPAAPVAPAPAPAVESEQTPRAVTRSPPASTAAEPAPSEATQPDNLPAIAGDAPLEGRAPSTDWDEERRRAIAGALTANARATDFAAFMADDRLEALPERAEPKPTRSIFDSQSSGRGGGASFMQPGQAKTKFGRKAREWCNALTGGALCGSPPDYPSGLFPEVMPEWMKRMPECTETRPLGPLLGESTEFPTIKCRMVRVEGEPLGER